MATVYLPGLEMAYKTRQQTCKRAVWNLPSGADPRATTQIEHHRLVGSFVVHHLLPGLVLQVNWLPCSDIRKSRRHGTPAGINFY